MASGGYCRSVLCMHLAYASSLAVECRDAVPSDLQYLSEENIEELGTPQCLYSRPSRFN
jgi:hypothetical protein